MNIESIMTKQVVTVSPDQTLKDLRKIFDKLKFHHILVEDNKKLAGVISDRDLLKDLSPNVDSHFATEKDLARLNRKVHQIMSRKPIAVHKETSIKEAAATMLENGISCLPVVTQDQEIVGVVTWRDFLNFYVMRID